MVLYLDKILPENELLYHSPEASCNWWQGKCWITLISNINQNNEIIEVSEGTGIKNDRTYYLQCKRIVGDLPGQAPELWCAISLLR